MGILAGEQSDNAAQVVYATTETVTTDANGQAVVDVSAANFTAVEGVAVTRVTATGTVGQVVVVGGAATTTDQVTVLFKSSTGQSEVNVQRKVSVVAVGQ